MGDLSNMTRLSGSGPALRDELKTLDQMKKDLLIKEGVLLEKAMQSRDPDDVIAANIRYQDVQQRQESGIKTTTLDPNEWSAGLGFRHKRFALSYETLRKMAKTPVIKAIIGTRQAQISAFSAPQKNKYDTGFVIRKKGEYYSDEPIKLSSGDKKKITQLTDFLLNCGNETNRWHGDTFDSFLKKMVHDSLALDQSCFEVVRNRAGIPTEFLAVDGGTIRVAASYDEDEYYESDKKKINGYLPSYVQVIDGEVKNEYWPWELCFGTRNVTTDIRNNMYGRSELEDLISVITWMLYGDAYNGKFFSQGSSPKGLLQVKGNVNRNRLAEFRQQWMAMVAGVQNAWKIPVLEGDMNWIDLQKNNKDMEFGKWQEYLIKIACAIYKISPEECGFNLGNASGGTPMMEASNEYKIKYSQDKGLKPLLKSLEFWINKWIVNPCDSSFEFAFVGIDIETEEKELEQNIKKLENFMGVKEIRELYGLSPDIADDDIILNQIYYQNKTAQAFDQEQADNTNEADGSFDWDQLEDNVEKSFEIYKDNPMMEDAFKMVMSED